MLSDVLSDPFGERSPALATIRLQLLGTPIEFAANSRTLMNLAQSAYRELPPHRLSSHPTALRVNLRLTEAPGTRGSQPRQSAQPPPFSMVSGAGLLGAGAGGSNFVVLSPTDRAALVVVSRDMLRHRYHTRYEMIEFAVFTLAARTQGLMPLHAACVGIDGRGVLLMGETGAGKSTAALSCLLGGFEFLAEDSVFVAPRSLQATGIANYLHVCADSLRWLSRRDAAFIRNSPVITRRSGVEKFEVDVRRRDFCLAPAPLKIVSIVFLSPQTATGPLLTPLGKTERLGRAAACQAYAASQPGWARFRAGLTGLPAFELRRGRHPQEAADLLRSLLANS